MCTFRVWEAGPTGPHSATLCKIDAVCSGEARDCDTNICVSRRSFLWRARGDPGMIGQSLRLSASREAGEGRGKSGRRHRSLHSLFLLVLRRYAIWRKGTCKSGIICEVGNLERRIEVRIYDRTFQFSIPFPQSNIAGQGTERTSHEIDNLFLRFPCLRDGSRKEADGAAMSTAGTVFESRTATRTCFRIVQMFLRPAVDPSNSFMDRKSRS